MALSSTYYVIPEHHMYLSDDRTELIFDQHLPGVRNTEIRAEVLEKSICLNLRSPGNINVSRCYALPYSVEPETAVGDFRDEVLHIKVRLKEPMGPSREVEL
jgi:HSP20 family molecular chaperone IbpA